MRIKHQIWSDLDLFLLSTFESVHWTVIFSRIDEKTISLQLSSKVLTFMCKIGFFIHITVVFLCINVLLCNSFNNGELNIWWFLLIWTLKLWMEMQKFSQHENSGGTAFLFSLLFVSPWSYKDSYNNNNNPDLLYSLRLQWWCMMNIRGFEQSFMYLRPKTRWLNTAFW